MDVRVQPEGLGPVQMVKGAQTVVIFDDYEQPVLAMQRTERGQILSVKAGDADFAKTLDAMGIGLNARVVVAPRIGGQSNES